MIKGNEEIRSQYFDNLKQPISTSKEVRHIFDLTKHRSSVALTTQDFSMNNLNEFGFRPIK